MSECRSARGYTLTLTPKPENPLVFRKKAVENELSKIVRGHIQQHASTAGNICKPQNKH